MENKAVDIDRALEEDEQGTMETMRMRPYLDIWDVSTHWDLRLNVPALLTFHKNLGQGAECSNPLLSANALLQLP